MKQEKRSLHMEDVLSMGFCILQNIFVPLQYSFKLGVLYMVTTSVNKEWVKLKDLSSAFSRSAFVDVLNYNDYSHFNWLASKYDTLKCTTYFELLKKSYSLISKYYRCEYVYKNELIKLLLKNMAQETRFISANSESGTLLLIW